MTTTTTTTTTDNTVDGAGAEVFTFTPGRMLYPTSTQTIQRDGFTLTLTVEKDTDDDPRNPEYACYSPARLAAWELDKWAFIYWVVRAERDGVMLAEVYSVGSLESDGVGDGAYYAELAEETAAAAVAAAREKIAELAAPVAGADAGKAPAVTDEEQAACAEEADETGALARKRGQPYRWAGYREPTAAERALADEILDEVLGPVRD